MSQLPTSAFTVFASTALVVQYAIDPAIGMYYAGRYALKKLLSIALIHDALFGDSELRLEGCIIASGFETGSPVSGLYASVV